MPFVIRTFVAVPNGVKIHIVLVVTDEKETEPRIEGINRHNEQDADNVTLLVRYSVGAKVSIDLQPKHKE